MNSLPSLPKHLPLIIIFFFVCATAWQRQLLLGALQHRTSNKSGTYQL